jgi:hypothetical protein
MLDCKAPAVTVETVTLESPNVTFSSITIPVSFGVFYSNNQKTNVDGILQFRAEFIELDITNSSVKTTNYFLNPCKQNDFQYMSMEKFYVFKIIGGVFGNYFFDYTILNQVFCYDFNESCQKRQCMILGQKNDFIRHEKDAQDSTGYHLICHVK